MQLFANNAKSTLSAGITNSQLTLVVQTGDGAKFPSPTSPDYFLATLDDGVNIEIVQVTARATDTFTIVRGQDGTSGTAFSSGALVQLRIPRAVLAEFHQREMQLNEWTGFGSGSPTVFPGAGNAFVYVKRVSGRPLLKVFPDTNMGSWDTPFQPALFQNSFFLIQPNTSTTIGVIGGSLTSVGTVSTPAGDAIGGCTWNQVTGAVAGNTAGTGSALAPYFRGSSITTPCGWFYVARLYFVDASYGSGATGFRAFVGLTSGTMAASVGADDPGGSCAGFTFSTNAGDTNWNFNTRDGTTRNEIGTGMPFTATHVYDFYCYLAPTGGTIYWRIDDLTAGTTAEGNTAANLPAAATFLRAGFQIATLTTTGRNIRGKKVYVETNN